MRPITLLDNENIEGKIVLLRVDYNVPIQDGVITDDFRIKSSLRTIEYLRNKKAKIIIIAHIEGKGADSFEAVAKYPFPFPIQYKKKIPLADNSQSQSALKEQLLEFKYDVVVPSPTGSVFLLESLRRNPGETANDPEFAAAFAAIADIFVGDAFSVAHRKHASIVGIPALLPHYAGFQIMEEVVQLQKGLNPNHPFIFVLGGAKFDTKLPLIEKFMHKADKVLIAGALLNDIMAGRGMEVGRSLVSKAKLPDEILKDPGHKLLNITDVIVKNIKTGEISIKRVDIEHGKAIDAISPDDNISDAGPSVISIMRFVIDQARAIGRQPFILWNGPLGNYDEGFPAQTIEFAKLILNSKVDALIGGGDTTAAISKLTSVGAVNAKDLGVYDKSGVAENHLSHSVYISTGGGAMIDYLIDETLPGIEALK